MAIGEIYRDEVVELTIMTDNLPIGDVYEEPVISRISFAGKDILEIGCGTGAFTFEYLKQANSILGIDPDGKAIDSLKAEWSNHSQNDKVDFRPGDMIDFPLPKKAFDIAIFSHSF